VSNKSEDASNQPYSLSEEFSKIMEVNEFGLPVLKRRKGSQRVTDAEVNKLKDELGI